MVETLKTPVYGGSCEETLKLEIESEDTRELNVYLNAKSYYFALLDTYNYLRRIIKNGIKTDTAAILDDFNEIMTDNGVSIDDLP